MKRKVRILIADDDSMLRRIFASMCSSLSGMELVGVAEDGEQALEQCKTLAPDVVLLDINMPKLSGIETLKRIKELAPDTCVVMLTAMSSVETVRECIAAGAHSYILKSNQTDEIRATIKNICFEQLKKIVGSPAAKKG
jgi:DNA-binding NarL/FixJ family response regulator